jgi:hypothetical protein
VWYWRRFAKASTEPLGVVEVCTVLTSVHVRLWNKLLVPPALILLVEPELTFAALGSARVKSDEVESVYRSSVRRMEPLLLA